jgi:uncharacterized coiled-coil DUF342 family protein
MSIPQNFLLEFEQKMSKLAEVRRNVQQSIQFKQQFTNELKTKLSQIYQRLQVLANLITQLKTKATTLETQITANSSDISSREGQIQQLQNQIANENQLKAQFQQQISELQNKIKTYEAQMKTLSDKSTALERDLQSRGDPNAHARAIQELTQKSELEKSQLVMQVNAANTTINELKQRLQQIEQNQNQNQGQVQTLQAQINQLKQENQQLINKLMAAIQAINDATNDLRTLMDTVPNVQTKQEVDQLLSQITTQIEDSIGSLNNASQGPPPNVPRSSGVFSMFGSRSSPPPVTIPGIPAARGIKPPPVPPRNFTPPPVPPTTMSSSGIQFTQNPMLPPRPDDNTLIAIPGRPTPTTVGELKNMLRLKARSVGKPRFGGDNKYQKVLNFIDQQPNIDEILNLLKVNGVIYKNNILMGGKKIKSTKKNKKQKGGFTYKSNYKRKSITSHSNYRRSKSSKRSSR